MSRFIRTKDRIYETWENGETCNGFGCKFNYGTIKIHKKDILKQADTIDELCDEIVVKENSSSKPILLGKLVDFDENGNKFYVKGEYSFKGIAYTLKELMEKYKEMSIKGAIWTDEGLTYIAKTNEEGDLELI